MKLLALLFAVLLSGCALIESPDGALLDEYQVLDTTMRQHRVAFADGRTLYLEHGGTCFWEEEHHDGRAAQGFRAPVVGDKVTLVTVWSEVPGEVVGTRGPWSYCYMADEVLPGMSGAGLWYADNFLAGTVRKASVLDNRLILARIPFIPGDLDAQDHLR